MKFINVKFKNFKSYPDNEVELDLSFKGAKLVVGKNGAGKSTALEAIGWIIYGKTQESSDGIVNRVTKKDCKGELNFFIGKDLYSIVRYRRHTEYGNKLFLFKNKKDVSSPKAPETQNMINDVVGIPYLGFISSIYYSMEQAGGFLRTKNSDRLKKIEAVLPIGSINAIRDKIKKDIDVLSEKEKALKDEKNAIEVSIEEKKYSIVRYKENCLRQEEEINKSIVKIDADIKYLKENNEENSKIDIDTEFKKIKNYSIKKAVDELKNSLNKSLVDLEKNLFELQNDLSSIPISKKVFKRNLLEKQICDISSEQLEISNIEKEISEIEEIDISSNLKLIEQKRKLEIVKLELENSIKNIQRDYSFLLEKEAEIERIQSEIEKKKISFNEAAEHRSVCPTCNQTITDEIFLIIKEKHEKELDVLQKNIVERKQEIESDKFNNVKKEFENTVPENKEKIEKISTAISAIIVKYSEDFLLSLEESKKKLTNDLLNKKNKINDTLKNNEKINSQLEILNSDIGDLTGFNLIDLNSLEEYEILENKISSEIQRINNSIKLSKEEDEEVKRKIDILESNYDESLGISKYSEDFLNNIKELNDKFNENIEKLERNKSDLNIKLTSLFDKEYVKQIENEIEPANNKLSETEKKLFATVNVLKHCAYLYEYILSNKSEGFKKYFISKIVDTFNEKINFFLEFFFEEKVEIVFDKELNEIIKVDGEEVAFNSFSSGQKTRAETAISFAMFSLVKVFFSNEINLAVFDEVLDANLDKEGVEAAINILKYFTEDNAVFIMSHREEVQEKFANKIVVVRENGLTRIKEI